MAVGVGLQKDFSWQQVGMSAVGAGIGAGIGAEMAVASKAGSQLPNMAPWVGAASKAALGNVLSQGAQYVIDGHHSFSWAEVAAAAVGAGVGAAAGSAMNVKSDSAFQRTGS